MKKTLLVLATFAVAGLANAALKPGDSLTPYEIQNCDTGQKYCQVCAYSEKPAKVIAFGKMNDEKFWADLERLQKLHTKFADQGLGVFAQVIDSKDTKAIDKLAKKHGITFPIVVPMEKDWNEFYEVNGVSRTIYYAKKNRVAWTTVGLTDKGFTTLSTHVEKDAQS